MKKTYRRPCIKVKKLIYQENILAASGEVDAGDIGFSGNPVDPSRSLSKDNVFGSWDDDNNTSSNINWDD